MEKEEKNSRRSFLKTATAGVIAAAVVPSTVSAGIKKPVIIPAGAKGANDRIRVAVLGINGRGKTHIEEIMGLAEKANVELAFLCDPDMNILQERAKEFETKYGRKVGIEQDFRKVYDDKTIDAVTLAKRFGLVRPGKMYMLRNRQLITFMKAGKLSKLPTSTTVSFSMVFSCGVLWLLRKPFSICRMV